MELLLFSTTAMLCSMMCSMIGEGYVCSFEATVSWNTPLFYTPAVVRNENKWCEYSTPYCGPDRESCVSYYSIAVRIGAAEAIYFLKCCFAVSNLQCSLSGSLEHPLPSFCWLRKLQCWTDLGTMPGHNNERRLSGRGLYLYCPLGLPKIEDKMINENLRNVQFHYRSIKMFPKETTKNVLNDILYSIFPISIFSMHLYTSRMLYSWADSSPQSEHISTLTVL